MRRRSFILSGLVGGALSVRARPQAVPARRAWFELRFFHLRNDFERVRLDLILKDVYLPASVRLGFGPLGFFNVTVGPDMPTLVSLTSYASLAAMEKALDGLAADATWNKALDEFAKPKELVYSRIESRLLRAFSTMPAIEVSPQEVGRVPRVFELRTYESRSLRASLTKIKMFEEEEIAIFRKTGLLPVFFAQTVIAAGLPSLTYMLAYESMEAREENWRKFVNHPDWVKLRSKPGYSESDLVSNIHSCFLRPTSYSPLQ